MKKREIVVEYQEYSEVDELTSADKSLLEHAKNAANRAYAPYSHFRVGAAVLLENGKIVTGNNQENAAYPSGLCAERVALFHASSLYPGIGVKAIAITAQSEETDIDEPVTPCGACRQVMVEYENISEGNTKVIMSGERGNIIIAPSVKSLIPLSFDGNHLLKNT